MRTLVECDAVVPQNKPDINKILQVEANSYIVSSEVKNDSLRNELHKKT